MIIIGLTPKYIFLGNGGFKHQEEQVDEILDVFVCGCAQGCVGRGFGFVSFDKYQAVEDVLRRLDHTIKGKSVEV